MKILRTNSAKNYSGYSLIEVLVAMFILVIIFSVTQANLRGYSQNKSLEQAVKQVRSDLKLLQEYSIAGKLMPGCSGLNGYIFSYNTSTNLYSLIADCTTDVNVPNKTSLSLPQGISLNSFRPPNNTILFKVLGKGTDIPNGTSINIIL